ncbi:MAG: response regulator [Kiritimatiellia bacterium]|jgi:CheY-like chemotaxis protein|nr:response regulator [Kiritimatiellia bacterium]MDP6810652.1 response regulator [Kiritimatiellia bacterium]MDP7023738.1 response regulator [Kiritimatiellia bacterium]
MDNEKNTILLIDDDTSLLVTLSDFLRSEGYEVVTADSGEQGLKQLKTLEPNLIILDMSMPGMGGIGFLKEITVDGKPKHPILVLTARANMAEFFADVDVDGFVAKPCAPEDLLMEVGRILFLRAGQEEDVGATSSPVKVLLGEDDAMLASKIEAELEGAGMLVSLVEQGPEMIEQAILQRPDVILCKQVLAKMNGDAVADMLRAMPNARAIPVVLYDDTGHLKDDVRPTGVSHVVLSEDPKALLSAVKAFTD